MDQQGRGIPRGREGCWEKGGQRRALWPLVTGWKGFEAVLGHLESNRAQPVTAEPTMPGRLGLSCHPSEKWRGHRIIPGPRRTEGLFSSSWSPGGPGETLSALDPAALKAQQGESPPAGGPRKLLLSP